MRTVPDGFWVSVSISLCRIQLLKSRLKSRQQARSGIGERDASCGSMKQPYTKAALQRADGLAHGGSCESKLLRSPDEAAALRHGGEGLEFREFGSAHLDVSPYYVCSA